MKKLTTQDIDLFVAGLNAEILQYVESIPAEARVESIKSSKDPIPTSFRKASASFFSEYYENTFFSGDTSATEDYFTGALSSAYDITGMETEIASAAQKYSVLLHQSQQAQLVFLQKDIPEYSSIYNNIKQSTALPVNAIVTTASQVESNKNQMTLAQAWAGFLRFKSDWSPKNRQESEKYYEVIEAVLGADTIVNNITRRDIKNLLEMAAGLPQQNKKPYNRMTTQECLDADDIAEEDLVSSRTVNGYLKLCQGLFAYLVKEEDVLELTCPQD